MPYRSMPNSRGSGLCRASITMILQVLAGIGLAGTAASETADAIIKGPVNGQASLSRLNIVLEGTRLMISLVGPARDFSGLDHPPDSPAEKKQLAHALDLLRSGDSLFLVPSGAWCRLISAAVSAPAADGPADSALQATWQFQCSAPAALNWIEARLLKIFPDTRKLATTVTTPGGTKSVVLTPGTPRILLPRPQ